ncbi:MATE family efflux transporter [bacterium]|nr:MATE family efflux transporter [bacterium]
MTTHSISAIKRFFKLLLQALSSGEKEYTSGNINKAIFILSVPVVIEMLGEGLFALVDIMYVTRLGENAIATVGLTEAIMFVVYSVAVGLSMATSALVSRRVGEKNDKQASISTFQAIILALIIGLALGFAGYQNAPALLRLMDASPEVIQHGLGYAQWIFGSNIIIMLLFIINGAFRGAGDSAIAMRVLLIANGLNIILDPLFIFGFGPVPAMGVKGAAIATGTGRAIAVLVQFYLLLKGNGRLKLMLKLLTIDLKIMGNLLRVSLGGIGQFLIESASWLVLIRLISKLGTPSVAGFTIGFRIIGFTLLPSWGLAQAAAALVGQNLGAKKPERAEESVWRSAYYNAGFLVLVSILFFLGADWLIAQVFPSSAEVEHLAALTLRVVCLGYVFFAFGMVITQAFNGSGDTLTPTLMNIFCFWIVQLPMAYVLMEVYQQGFMGVLICIAICHSLNAVIGIILFRRGRWKLREV